MRWCSKRFGELDTYLYVDDYVCTYVGISAFGGVFFKKKERILLCQCEFSVQSKNRKENSDSSVFLETLPGCCGPRK